MANEVTSQQNELDWMLAQHAKVKPMATEEKMKTPLSLVPVPIQPQFSMASELSDANLIERGCKSPKFATLLSGEWSGYASQSEADQAFANLVAFFTEDPTQIDSVFRQSGLMRDKWDEPHDADGNTYGQITIAKALAGTSAAAGCKARAEYACTSSASAVQAKPVVCAPTFQFIRAGDLLAKPKSIPWLIKGMFEQAGLLQLIGATGSAKTFMVIDWVSCISTGREWNGNSVSQGAVFYIAGEGHAGFGRRLRAWELENETSLADAPIYVSTMPAALMNVANAQAVSTAVETLAAESGVEPKLIVIDTFARNLGSGDENNNADASAFINNIDVHLRARFNAAVLIVHHTGHLESQRGRGASAMRTAMDSEYLLAVNGDYRSLTCTKSKETELGEPIDFKLKEVALDGWTDEDGVLMTSAVIVRAEGSAPKAKGKSPPRLKGANKIALEALHQALHEHGAAPSHELMEDVGDILAPSKVVLIEHWRDRAYTSSISTEGPDAKRMAFKRACDALRDAGFVEIWKDECCSTSPF